LIIAIDGPAGSGKSTTAQAVAEKLGFKYINTGSMYRAIGFAFLEAKIPVEAIDAAWVQSVGLRVEYDSRHKMLVYVGEREVSPFLNAPEIGEAASIVSAVECVRTVAVEQQKNLISRNAGLGSGVVLEGRDIGTVVAPDADVKVYMDASPSARAQRRLGQLLEAGADVTLPDIVAEIVARDERDRSRTHSPLSIATDAIVVDTTRMTIDEQVDLIVNLASSRLDQDQVNQDPA